MTSWEITQQWGFQGVSHIGNDFGIFLAWFGRGSLADSRLTHFNTKIKQLALNEFEKTYILKAV